MIYVIQRSTKFFLLLVKIQMRIYGTHIRAQIVKIQEHINKCTILMSFVHNIVIIPKCIK